METKNIIDYVVISESRINNSKGYNATRILELISEYKSQVNKETKDIKLCQYVLSIIAKIPVVGKNDNFKTYNHNLDDKVKKDLEDLFNHLANNFDGVYVNTFNKIKLYYDYITIEDNEKLLNNIAALEHIIKKLQSNIEELNANIQKLESKMELFKKIYPEGSQNLIDNSFLMKLNDFSKKGYVLQGGYIVNEGIGYQTMVKYED